MPKFCANLSMLYPELPFLDRFEAASRDGFKGVEFLFPYSFAPQDVALRLREHGLQQVLFNAPPGPFTGPESIAAWDPTGVRGLACLPGHQDAFRQGIQAALDYANELDCPRIHVMAGLIPPGTTREAVRPTYLANLHWAAEQAATHGRDVLIEPINTRDVPRYFLNRQDHAHEVIQEVGAGNLKVQMDLYHCQIVEGDVASKIRQYVPTGRVGHFQIAGVPERHEPDVGELDYPYLFGVIDEVAKTCNWNGWVGCEYRPALGATTGGTTAGLGWLKRRNHQ